MNCFSLNQLNNGVLVNGATGGLGMSDELIQLLALSEITATSYEIANISLMRLGTNGGEQLTLTDSYFSLGAESYHISGDADTIGITGDNLVSIKGRAVDILGSITLSNPSNAEDIDSVIKLNQEDIQVAGNKIDITTNEFKINGVAVNPNVAQEVAENNINPVSSGAVYSHVAQKTMSSASMCQVVNYVDGIISDTIPTQCQAKKAVSGQAVINYVASELSTMQNNPVKPVKVSDNIHALDEQGEEIPDEYTGDAVSGIAVAGRLERYPTWDDFWDTLGEKLGELEVETVKEYVDNKINNLPTAPEPPALTFKTQFIDTMDWNDLSTCWILLNVCHIELNLISNSNMASFGDIHCGKLTNGMPIPSETVMAQLASLSGILTLRLEPNGDIILASDTVEANTQINVSIFYTFTEYQDYTPIPAVY
jgi:hypothetical protein